MRMDIVIGVLWGIISSIGFLYQLTKPIWEVNFIYYILFLPGAIVAKTVLGPSIALITGYFVISIIVGAFIVRIILVIYNKIFSNK